MRDRFNVKTRALAAVGAAGFAAALVLTGGNAFGTGNGFGNQCPKATNGAHGACVRELARHHGNSTTTTAAPTTTTAAPTTTTSTP
jgi:hypothetical protein